MKFSLLPILTFLFLSSIGNAQWINQNPVPNGNNLYSTYFIDDNIGWIVGSDGFIIKTTNAGVDWVQQNCNTNLILKSVQFVDQNTGWICGEGGLILKTTNGGFNWFILESRTNEHLTDIYFNDLNTGYAIGFGGTIIKTTDGGSTWGILPTGYSSDLYDVDFIDAFVGYAVGGEYGSYSILKTTNGGLSWVNIYHNGINLTYENYILSVQFIDENIGFVGGGGQWNDFIYKTTDGGETWTPLSLSDSKKKEQTHRETNDVYYSGGINSIYYNDSNIGFAVAGNGYGWNRQIYTTTDGGSSWESKYSGWEENGLISVWGNSRGQGWAVGFSGAIFITEDNGNSWAQILSGDKSSNFSGDDIYSVICINENILWAVGKRDRWLPSAGDVILKTTNGGKIWKTQRFFQSTEGPTTSVHFINEDIGWAVGKGITGIYRTTNGGENWIEGDGSYSSVYFIDQYTGWATNDNNCTGTYKSTDGGITWTQKNAVSSSSIFFSDINIGWAVGESGSILKSTDGGETWISKISGTENKLHSVKFYDSNIGMCVGDAGTILLSTDAGESWTQQAVITNNDLNAITFTSSTSIWISGMNGTILNSNNLGLNWISNEDVTQNDLTSLCFIDENTGWFGGMNGTMFKYQIDITPVELISFTANVDEDLIQLNWQTATETNNYGFEIERCTELENWSRIGFVEGHGNSSTPHFYSFADKYVVGGNKFNYRLKQIDIDGNYSYSDAIEVKFLSDEFVIHQNYPNPFNPSTKIKFSLKHSSLISIKVFDLTGAEVDTLVDEEMSEGTYEITWNAVNLPSGVYFYQLRAGSYVESKKMMLAK